MKKYIDYSCFNGINVLAFSLYSTKFSLKYFNSSLLVRSFKKLERLTSVFPIKMIIRKPDAP